MKLRSSSTKNVEKYGRYNPIPKQTDNIYLAKSTVCDGIGVFANKSMKRHTAITHYCGTIKKKGDGKYDLGISEDKILVGNNNIKELVGKGVAQLVNDNLCICITGNDANCYFKITIENGEYLVTMKSARNIQKNEELFVHYGWSYWKKTHKKELSKKIQKQLETHYPLDVSYTKFNYCPLWKKK